MNPTVCGLNYKIYKCSLILDLIFCDDHKSSKHLSYILVEFILLTKNVLDQDGALDAIALKRSW